MRAVVQRVTKGQVTLEGEVIGAIGKGFVVLLGIGRDDTSRDVEYLVDKIVNLRVFDDAAGKMNCSLLDVGGELLAISQFTLYGDCRKGRRPSFIAAAAPEEAVLLYNEFVKKVAAYGIAVATGRFQALMQVDIHNDGPVTLLIDSKKEF
ncbi:MAG: D-aminoacyl-tRNA deacylase [bacterium]